MKYRMLMSLLAATAFCSVAPGADKPSPKQNQPRQPAFLKDTPEQFIKRFDRNKDGLLTRDELPLFLARNFERFDTNKDGKLDTKEVTALLRLLRQRFAQRGPPS